MSYCNYNIQSRTFQLAIGALFSCHSLEQSLSLFRLENFYTLINHTTVVIIMKRRPQKEKPVNEQTKNILFLIIFYGGSWAVCKCKKCALCVEMCCYLPYGATFFSLKVYNNNPVKIHFWRVCIRQHGSIRHKIVFKLQNPQLAIIQLSNLILLLPVLFTFAL